MDVFLKGLLISAICQITFYYFNLYDLRPIGSTQILLVLPVRSALPSGIGGR